MNLEDLKEVTLYSVTGISSYIVGSGAGKVKDNHFHVGTFRSKARAKRAAESVKGQALPSRPGIIHEIKAYKTACGKLLTLHEIQTDD